MKPFQTLSKNILLVLAGFILCLFQMTKSEDEGPNITGQISLRDLLEALNLARTNPQYYSHDYIKKNFEDKVTKKEGESRCFLAEHNYKFKEVCPNQFEVLRKDFKKDLRMPKLRLDLGLTYIVKEQTQYIATKAHSTSSKGPPGKETLKDRLEDMTKEYVGAYTEVFFSVTSRSFDAKDIVSLLMLDEGASSRPKRRALLHGDYSRVGLAIETAKGSDKKIYLGFLLASNFECNNCRQLDCGARKRLGYTQFLQDIGKATRCLGNIVGFIIANLVLYFSLTL